MSQYHCCRWIKKNEEVKEVVEALDDIEDIVAKDNLIEELKRVKIMDMKTSGNSK